MFSKFVTPKPVTNSEDLFLFKCSKCGNVHFRHAGYVEMLVPFIRADKQERVDASSSQVKVCTKCKSAFLWYNEQMYDVSSLIDVEAWAKTEREMQQATGPGGDC